MFWKAGTAVGQAESRKSPGLCGVRRWHSDGGWQGWRPREGPALVLRRQESTGGFCPGGNDLGLKYAGGRVVGNG